MRPSIVGTTIAWVTASSRAVPTQDSGVKAGRYTTRRPAYTPVITAEMPATWYGGTLTSAASSSSALMKSTVVMTYEARWRWRSTAALGSPVVPLVNSRMAMSSGDAASVDGASSGSTASQLLEELGAGDQLDTVDLPDARRDGVLDHDDGRRGAGEDGRQLVVGQAVVHRHVGHAGDAGTEQEGRHDVRVDVDEADPLDAARGAPGTGAPRPGRAARRR